MMLLAIILSIGAVYAFIPIVIIIILILAARGAGGKDFFELFGVGTLLGLGGRGAGGIKSGGRGITGRVKYNPTKLKAGPKEIAKFAATPVTLPVKLYKKAVANEKKLLAVMDESQIRSMLMNYGIPAAAFAAMNKEQLVDFAVQKLHLSQVRSYSARFVSPKGDMNPLSAPKKSAPTFLGVRMSVGDYKTFYKDYYKARKARAVNTFNAGKQGVQSSGPNAAGGNAPGTATNAVSNEQGLAQRKEGQASGSPQQGPTNINDINEGNFFRILGLTAKPDDLESARKAYLAQIKKAHPDLSPGASSEEAVRLNAAYNYAKTHAKDIWGKKE